MSPILFKNILIQLLSLAKISGEEKIVAQHHRSGYCHGEVNELNGSGQLGLAYVFGKGL